jgi:hypothetical protein
MLLTSDGLLHFQTARHAWPQEAQSEIVEVSIAYSSFVVSRQYVIFHYINIKKFIIH